MSGCWRFRMRPFVKIYFFKPQILDGEKKAKKRPYEEIKVTDGDFASQSSPANPPQVLCGKIYGSVRCNCILTLHNCWPNILNRTHLVCFRQRIWSGRCRSWRTQPRVTPPYDRGSLLYPQRCRTRPCCTESQVCVNAEANVYSVDSAFKVFDPLLQWRGSRQKTVLL